MRSIRPDVFDPLAMVVCIALKERGWKRQVDQAVTVEASLEEQRQPFPECETEDSAWIGDRMRVRTRVWDSGYDSWEIMQGLCKAGASTLN